MEMEHSGINRGKRQKINSAVALLNQGVVITCGFILPRLIIGFYGSKVNGLVSSITQFLSLITVMDLGVSAVVQSALYKPLAYGDENSISQIMKSARRYFKKIAYGFIIYTVILCFVYPGFSSNAFDTVFTVSLILIMSVSMYMRYFLGITNMILLNADHKSYIYLSIYSVSLIINIIAATICIKLGASIQVLRVFTSLAFLIRPFFLLYYVSGHYNIDRKIEVIGEPIKQKWNGMAQHMAHFVSVNTDILVLTVFSTLESVSIYMVYKLVVTGVNQIIQSISTGMPAYLGNLYAQEKMEELLKIFGRFEWLIHTIATFAFSVCGVLIVEFVRVYTRGVNDANYIVPVFAVLIVFAQIMFALRIPYNMLILAAGHYKQTQLSSVIEMVLNISISILLVIRFGLVGVAIGTVVAMSYRVIYLVIYLSKHITQRATGYFSKHILVDVIGGLLIIVSGLLVGLAELSFVAFLSQAVLVGLYGLAVILAVNYLFYKEYLLYYVKGILTVIKR